MASFEIEWKRSAEKELRKLPSEIRRRVLEVVAHLAADPHPSGSRKLVAQDRAYRVRIGDYRVV